MSDFTLLLLNLACCCAGLFFIGGMLVSLRASHPQTNNEPDHPY